MVGHRTHRGGSGISAERILIADDEPQIIKYLRANLVASGYQALVANGGQAALALAREQNPDLIILDLCMPDLDGFQVCRELRGWSTTPILVLSARQDQADKVTALDLGADDYLTKPFSPEELLARVRAILRRKRYMPAPARILYFGSVALDLQRRTLTRAGQSVRLTRTEGDLLFALAANAGRVLTHRMLLQQVWGPEYGGEIEYLWAFVRRLRQKLEADNSQPRIILTEPGVGYRCALPDPTPAITPKA